MAKFRLGDRVAVHIDAKQGRLFIAENFPFEATIVLVDPPGGQQGYDVKTDRGARWGVLETMLQPVSREHDSHEEWKHAFTRAAHERADDNGWSEEFDDLMAEYGLDRRTKAYTADVYLSAKVEVKVEASSEEDARQAARRVTSATKYLLQVDADLTDAGYSAVDTLFGRVGNVSAD